MHTEEVILVDASDKERGAMEKLEAHQKGLLHRAVSVFIFNDEGQLLLQQRAKSKYHSAGLWTNTCCGHPRPGEETMAAAQRRLKEEMGIDCELEKKFEFSYRAELENNLTEHEYDHVFFGSYNGPPALNADEADNYQWQSIAQIKKRIKENPGHFTIWFRIIMEEEF